MAASSATVEQEERPVVALRLHARDQPVGAVHEALLHEPLGLAEQLVDAVGDVALGRLDEPVGVEQQRVPRASSGRDAS